MEKSQDLYKKILNLEPSKSESRKIAILEAVLDAISYGGIHNITSQEIGKRAKMRRSHVVYYFKNRDELIDAAIDYAIATAQNTAIAYMQGEKDRHELLDCYIKSNFAWLHAYPRHGAVILLLFYLSSSLPDYREKLKQVNEMGEERIALILKMGKAQSGRGPHAIKRAARNIRNVLTGNLVMVATMKDAINVKNIEQDTIKAAQQIAEGIWK